MLLPVEGVFSREEVVQLRELLVKASEQGLWQDGRATAGSQALLVKQNLQLDDDADLTRQLSDTVIRRLAGHPLFMSAALPLKIFPPKFNCYQNGGHYGLHVDSAVMTLPDRSTMRTDVSATLFLSDADEYEGGELLIETRFGAQPVKLNAGDMIIYPSDSLHEVTPVTQGQRIASFFWLQSLVRSPGQRALLFELDQSVQALSTRLGSSDTEVRRLSHNYHNLMREWAET